MLRVLIFNVPPSGIASRALTQRLRTALWNWAGSSRTGSSVGSSSISSSIVSPTARRNNSRKSVRRWFGLTVSG
jgi:hypothetical protein